jgi:alpha-amylase/alpha-mannosidase (GH57 family)
MPWSFGGLLARVVFLWHLHQPEYRDPLSGQPVLPWVRLHSTRAYNDMAAALEPHDRVRVVANFAPSLLLQLEAYVAGTIQDKDEEIARKPADALSAEERAHVVKESFSIDWDLWVKPIPRYAELLAKRGKDLRKLDLRRAQERFSVQELVDLQVHFMLAWMGFAARREEPLVQELLRKERGFSDREKIDLLDLSRRIARGVVPRWKKLAERGLVEITCSPLFHPILPLLVDTESARRAMPDVPLPPRFRHPEDAREQVKRGLDRAEKDFGVRPLGMWPSEGSVSPEVLEILSGCGVRWCATDQGNLERSEVESRPQGALHTVPWKCGDVAMFFRDREASDAIGFRYGKSDPQGAVRDLLGRIASAGENACVTVALDGENPWERYPNSGEGFLKELYTQLDKPGPVQAVQPREEIAARPPSRRILRLHSGSWIDSNYRIWIGQSEDNQAWTLLGLARDAYETSNAPLEQKEKAYQALLAAEGSDWFWWYGDDFTTDNAAEFDTLFRRHVLQAFRHLGIPPPERLGRPIIAPYKDASQANAVVVQPRRLVAPLIDGFSHGYFEWSGAGIYNPGQGSSMYQGSPSTFVQLWFGFSKESLFLRLDPARGWSPSGELQIVLTRAGAPETAPGARAREAFAEKILRMRLAEGECPVVDGLQARVGVGRVGNIVELGIELARTGLLPNDSIGVLLRLTRDDVELDRLPRYGELTIAVPDDTFESAHWHV